MNILIAIIAPLITMAQSIGNENIFEPDRTAPIEVMDMSKLRCAYDLAEIRYFTSLKNGDRVASILVNGRPIRKFYIDAVNSHVGLRHISKISWQSCPSSKRDTKPIKFNMEFETNEGINFAVFLLSRDGSLTRE